MKRSEAARLARLFALVAAVLAATTGGIYVQRKWVAHVEQKKAPPAPPVDVERQSSGLTFSKVDGNRIIFTVHAMKSTDFRGQDASLLEEVEVTAFGKAGDRNDVMHTKSCRYAKTDGSIQCDGDVLIELQSAADAALSKKQGGLPVGVARVETSGVTFERATGQAQTVKPVNFSFPSGKGKGIGAVYSSEEGQLRLIRDVEIELVAAASNKPVKAIAPKEPVIITGSSLEFARNAHTLYLDGPVSAKTKTQELNSGELTMWMDTNFRAQTVVATPGTRNITPIISMHSQKGFSTLVAQKLTSQLAPQGWISSLKAEGAVKGNSADSKMSSETAEVEMWPQVNEAKLLTLRGNVQVDTREAKTAALHTLRTNALQLSFDDGKSGQASRVKHGETLDHGTTESTDANGVRTRLDADKLAADFGAKGKAQQVTATGAVRTEREMTGKPVQRASAATGVMVMGSTGEWSKINLHGNVRMKEGDRSAEADDSVMIHDPETAVLTGKAFVRDATSETHAAKITFFQESGNFQAEGNVRSTDFSSKTATVQLSSNAPANLSSDRMDGNSKTGRALYTGHARMWQGPSVLEADSIELLRDAHTLNASGNVKGVFPQVPREDDASTAKKPPTLWHVSSGRLSYFDLENRARLEENVIVQSVDQKMRAPLLDLYFTQATDGKKDGSKQIDRAIGREGVLVEEAERRATAETGVYTAADQKFVLSGGNPTIYDATEGTTTGRELTFYIASDTIIVDSGNGLRTLTKHRVQR
jgi:lipopolysaccharide export system protein LptA